MQRMGQEPGVTRRGFDRAVSVAPRLVEPTEHETGAPQRMVVPTLIADASRRLLTLEQLLTFPESAQRLIRFAELRHCPSGGRDHPGKLEDDVRGPEHRDRMLEQ